MIELYTWSTPNGRKVSIMLEECALPYHVHKINIGTNTEQFTPEFKVPVDLSRPYDPQPDYEGNIWFGDDGQGGCAETELANVPAANWHARPP